MLIKVKKYISLFFLLFIAISILPSVAFAFDTKVIDWAIRELCGHITGNLGGLLVTVAGFGAIVSAALGSFRVTYSAIIVAVGAYAISSIESLYFDKAATECTKGADAPSSSTVTPGGAPGVKPNVGGLNRSSDSVSQSEGTNTLYKDKTQVDDPFANLD